MYDSDHYPVAQIAAEFGVTRPTTYRHLAASSLTAASTDVDGDDPTPPGPPDVPRLQHSILAGSSSIPGYWAVLDGLPVLQFSHHDATALCRTSTGVANPIESA